MAWFAPSSKAIADIKHFLGFALAAQGEEAIQAVRTKGWLQVAGGLVLMLVAIVLFVGSLIQAFGNPKGGRYFIAIGLLAFGGSLLGFGFASLRRARRAERGGERGD